MRCSERDDTINSSMESFCSGTENSTQRMIVIVQTLSILQHQPHTEQNCTYGELILEHCVRESFSRLSSCGGCIHSNMHTDFIVQFHSFKLEDVWDFHCKIKPGVEIRSRPLVSGCKNIQGLVIGA